MVPELVFMIILFGGDQKTTYHHIGKLVPFPNACGHPGMFLTTMIPQVNKH